MLAPPPGDAYLFMISRMFPLNISMPLCLLMTSNSIIILLSHYQYACVTRFVAVIHSFLSRVGLESTIPCTEGYHYSVLPVKCIPHRRPSDPTNPWDQDLRTSSLLGKSHACSLLDQYLSWNEFQLHVFVAYVVSIIGVAYWYVRCIWLPKRNGYTLERKWALQDDGVSRYVLHHVE